MVMIAGVLWLLEGLLSCIAPESEGNFGALIRRESLVHVIAFRPQASEESPHLSPSRLFFCI